MAILTLLEPHVMKIAHIFLLWWLPTVVTLGFIWFVTTHGLALEMAAGLLVLLMFCSLDPRPLFLGLVKAIVHAAATWRSRSQTFQLVARKQPYLL